VRKAVGFVVLPTSMLLSYNAGKKTLARLQMIVCDACLLQVQVAACCTLKKKREKKRVDE